MLTLAHLGTELLYLPAQSLIVSPCTLHVCLQQQVPR